MKTEFDVHKAKFDELVKSLKFPPPSRWSLYTLDTGGGYNCFELHDFFTSLDSGGSRNPAIY